MHVIFEHDLHAELHVPEQRQHERPEAMEQAVVMMTGLAPERVLQALDVLERQTGRPRLPVDYSVPDVAEKVLRIIMSYTDYVRRGLVNAR